jgi:transcriptional regulator with GAF, ATPase, and Fis domain
LDLRAELELLRTRAGDVATDDEIPEGFHLRDFLAAHERALFVRALNQASGNASEAARLLGIQPHAFRARATTLAVRARREIGQ